MKKILASIAAVVAISALSIAASAEGIGEATFEAEGTTVSAVTLPATLDPTTAGEPESSEAEATTAETVVVLSEGSAAQGNGGLLIATNGSGAGSTEGNKVSSGVAEVIVPVLAAAGAVAFIVSRKK
ncbi:hypothetical protein FACS1894133_4790 [Clostridia bacterium]|nr:hypothetical protein FACS1894133_4790 [Clostridia bacterium]